MKRLMMIGVMLSPMACATTVDKSVTPKFKVGENVSVNLNDNGNHSWDGYILTINDIVDGVRHYDVRVYTAAGNPFIFVDMYEEWISPR
jgi:hypothetical protein